MTNASTHLGLLAGRRAIVTGAARGIGAAIARSFAAEGAQLALLDRMPEACATVAASIGASVVEVDLADPESTRRAMEQAIDVLGGVDILVNNAGVLHMAPLLDISVADWDHTFAVNARAMLLTIQAAAPHLMNNPHASIINLASMGAKVGAPRQAHYAASKAAVISLTQVAAKELGEFSVRVNSICPGYVLTDMGAETRTPEMVATWSALSPLGRCAEPTDVAEMALFLASDRSRYCTGQAMNVTGGMVMH